ncbi:hypothetical protein C479_07308 [Halovivax asiaticus JCM 14624]|uniref:Uncharacterized protein n=1 Tax=Halovivax asiaticus JCM 14624 TaxID=1227490 RepID=M0BKV3_9EURY|nr:hypothetical protein [Halovivax asiaticus]ELZ11097.1 hypothetical protein C479_07308 [Halovivax asiaticus JCM 14624]
MLSARLWYASIAVCGAILGGMGLSSVVSGRIALVPVSLSIGGVGMIAGVIYDVFISSSSLDTMPDTRAVWITIVMAAIGGLAGIWALVG